MMSPGMSLDLIVLLPEAALSYERALSIYHSEDDEGDPSTSALAGVRG